MKKTKKKWKISTEEIINDLQFDEEINKNPLFLSLGLGTGAILGSTMYLFFDNVFFVVYGVCLGLFTGALLHLIRKKK